ncbi:MAG: hypothetical protein AAB426_07970 [Myxococcota bacterium]
MGAAALVAVRRRPDFHAIAAKSVNDFESLAALGMPFDVSRSGEVTPRALGTAGGAIRVASAADGQLRAARQPVPERLALAQEMALRHEGWALFSLLNLRQSSPPLAPPQLAVLERFAMTDPGAAFVRRVNDETVVAFNRGWLEHHAWATAKTPDGLSLSQLLTGALTEDGLFAENFHLFRVESYAGRGARAAPGVLWLGDQLFGERFAVGGQRVDPMALLAHETGHTRFGEPESGADIHGEALAVRRYENFVRRLDGYEPRRVYYRAGSDETIDVDTCEVRPGKWRYDELTRRLVPLGD